MTKVSGDCIYHSLGYEWVYLPFFKAADTPFHLQREHICKYYNLVLCMKNSPYRPNAEYWYHLRTCHGLK